MKEAAGEGTMDGLMCRNKLHSPGQGRRKPPPRCTAQAVVAATALDGAFTRDSQGNCGLQLCLFSLPGKGPPFLSAAETINFGTRRQCLPLSGGASEDCSGLSKSVGLELELLEDVAYR